MSDGETPSQTLLKMADVEDGRKHHTVASLFRTAAMRGDKEAADYLRMVRETGNAARRILAKEAKE